jgi:hypothetical protein
MRLEPRECWSKGLEADAMANAGFKWELQVRERKER